ncbi:ABC transporter permease [Methylobacterium sp. Leaf469]|uniref:ABC transporter permease n=1 Tax=unclassified Methylobacterium TaxID=2615210 RepID=UPI0006F60494|nr:MULTISPECIES: ABC transporter permease subunit [unclassified Methylobacterium]KQO72099.1 ABC transporter permease [Methylobacterium sp. Leaf87]KQP25124.1 ABC transporter permease [Methylobacterium sp. Leaf102]KQP28996.1 ABC transporter permease [Methylobacterium sp. Leaf100]KQP58913.1 ABC transporter permease [Methylobacterium sp. Leaf112]KQT87729.1 ABC transporter permease [Methylobacterium sp. Leaf469]
MGTATRLVSVLVLLAGWQAAAVAAGSRLLPAPLAILSFIQSESASGDLWSNVGITLARVGISFVLAMVLGVLLGIALGRSRRLNLVLDTPLLILLNTPALVITVLAYIWVGLNEGAAVLAVVLNKLPNVAVILREGARGLDPQLEEMARTYRFDRRTWIAHVLVPQLQPFVVAAARSGLSLAWKIVLVIELLGRPNGVGFAINYYFVQSLNVAAIVGYSIVFMSVMIAIDILVLQRLEAHVRRWR